MPFHATLAQFGVIFILMQGRRSAKKLLKHSSPPPEALCPLAC